MSALAHYIEAEGVATVGISLVREHSEHVHPPRTLWVPFEFGRPLGVPNDRAFQRGVVQAALGLLERPAGPVIADYPIEAPVAAEEEGWACPISLPPPDEGATDAERTVRAVLDEVARLRPWYEEALRARGRTTIGVSGLDASGIDAIVETLARFAAGETVAAPPGTAHELPRLFRYLADDARAFYLEAATARPSRVPPGGDELARWLYTETVLGAVLARARERLAVSADPDEQRAQGGLLPGVFVSLRKSEAAG
ncbi:MAG: hypothetical protein WEB13_10680 [Dehalococcoidia bacterium]